MKDKETLKWIYKHSKGQTLKITLLTLLRSVMAVLGVVFALASRYVIDFAVAKDIEGLWMSAGIIILLVGIRILLGMVGKTVETTILARLTLDIRGKVFGTLLRRDYSALGGYHSGDLMTRLNNDVGIVSNGIITLVPRVVALFVGLLYALYALIAIDVNFAFIFLAGGVILVLTISAFRGVMKKLHKQVQETEAKARSYFQESIGSILMIKVFGIEETIDKKAAELQDDNFRAQMKRRNLSVFASAGLSTVFNVGSLYALVFSAYRLYLGAISFGTLTSVVQLVNQIQAPFAGISGIMPQYYSVLASAERIIEIEALPEEPLEYPLLDRGRAYDGLERMTFENICFSYGREVVLKDASLEIKKGDFVVIGGISGIGKSTLIKLLLGVIKPQKGRILLRINGEDVPAGKHSRPLFSYVPQGNLLLSGTIREAVSVANENLSDEKIMAAARISCADTFIERLPDGLDTYIGEKGFGLSEGQIQRLAITRAILSDAPIILLDEATSALDETTEARLLNNIKELKDKTCVIISHKRAAFEICNKHVFIEEQRIRTEE